MALAKADNILSQADKKSNKFDWFGMQKQINQEDAADLYVKAAAQYKIAKEFKKAGDCYKKGAESQMAAGNEIEAKQSWRDAGQMYRHIDANLAIDAYKNAIQLSLDADRFGQAARLQEEIGDLLAEDDHLEQAIAAYEKSAEYYEAENDSGNANKRLLKVAHMSAKAGKYERAIEIFEKLATSSVDNNLLRWKVKEYLFKALICQLCAACEDDVKSWTKMEQTAERYSDISDIYATSREAKLLTGVLEAVSKLDMDLFKDSVSDFDRIQRLEPWATELMLNIEHYITGKQHEAPDLDGFDDEKKEDNTYDNDVATTNNNNNNNKNISSTTNPFDQGSDPNAPDLDDAPEL